MTDTRWGDGCARRRQEADFFEFVAADALRGWRSTKRRMAVGTIELLVDFIQLQPGNLVVKIVRSPITMTFGTVGSE